MHKTVETGTIRKRDQSSLVPYEMRILDASCAEAVLSVQQELLSDMTHPDGCVCLSEEEIYHILKGHGQMVGIYVKHQWIAFAASLFPGKRSDNLGRDMGFGEEELQKVAHLEFAAVHPVYRGNALQKKMAGFLMHKILSADDRAYIMNTISPYNPASLRTAFSLGLRIRKLSFKYDNLLRYILVNDVQKTVQPDMNTVISVGRTDFDQQQIFLEQGYCGVGFDKDIHNDNILYAKGVQK